MNESPKATGAESAGQWRGQAEATLERIKGWAEQARRSAEKSAEVAASVDALVIEAWSPRREVRVELDGSGTMRDIEFADSAPSGSPLALSRAVQAAHDAALRDLNEQVQQIAEERLADQPELRDSLQTTYGQAISARLEGDTDEP